MTEQPDAPNAPRFRSAEATDAEQIAELHAESWRRHYRGAFADSFLDGDVVTERLAVWSERLSNPSGTATILAEQQDGHLLGFVHVELDADPKWGSLIDNLHVTPSRHRSGIGTRLLREAAQAITTQATTEPMYLWVLDQNTKAQQFYLASGATRVETATAFPPGGNPTRLNGTPPCHRMHWPHPTHLL